MLYHTHLGFFAPTPTTLSTMVSIFCQEPNTNLHNIWRAPNGYNFEQKKFIAYKFILIYFLWHWVVSAFIPFLRHGSLLPESERLGICMNKYIIGRGSGHHRRTVGSSTLYSVQRVSGNHPLYNIHCISSKHLSYHIFNMIVC